jgi:hypothetical protein
MPAKFSIGCNRFRIFLAGIITLAAAVINLNQALPQTAGKIKIGLLDFSISFLWKR